VALEIFEALEQEQLAAALVEQLAVESGIRGVLEPAQVVVQNAGLGRWLRLWHARTCGISAAVDMPFARSFIANVLEGAGLYRRQAALDGNALTWQIFQLLSRRAFEEWGRGAAPLQAYLAADRPMLERRYWQLSVQMADLIDQYAIYRPEWLQAWLRGEYTAAPVMHWAWQGRLFCEVINGLGISPDEVSRRLFGLALHTFCNGAGSPEASPLPLHVFGISSFSPLFLQFFQRLSASRDVKVYHLVCSEVFLGDLPRSYRQAILQAALPFGDGTELAATLNNSILIASGQAAARFQSLLLALDYPIGDQPTFPARGGTSDLQALQDALRENRGTTEFRADGTVSFHACHSRKREVQVLQQQLLALFAADPDLRPEEIMVLAPEIMEYANAIEIVFGEGVVVGDDTEPTRIPYCVADRLGRIDENCWRFLIALLELLKGRQPFSQVAGLLDFDPVCERLQIGRDELQELLKLLQESGIRWGIDPETREQQGLPPYEAYSWEYGLLRLYDGLIFPLQGNPARAPLPASSRMAEVVGQLTQLLRPIFRLVKSRGRSRTFAEWTEELLAVVHACLRDDNDGAQWMRTMALTLGRIRAVATAVPIGFDTFAHIVAEGREEPSGPSGLLRRGITFCRLQPVRHIPAKVICILGMNEGEYPRQDRLAEFNLMDLQRIHARQWKGGPLALTEIHFLGDHRIREEDRQLFLDCVLNARQRLYISYVGQSDKSNESIPPSLLVSELLQFLQHPTSEANAEIRQAHVARVHLRHPLQDWSRQNFYHPQPSAGEPPVLIHFEHPPEAMERQTAAPFLGGAARSDEENVFVPLTHADTAQLVSLLTDPAHYYLKRRLQVNLDQLKWMDVHEDWEALESDGKDLWSLRKRLFDEWVTMRRTVGRFHPEDARSRLQAELQLPPGLAGEALWRCECQPVLDSLEQYLGTATLQQSRVDRVFDMLSFSSEDWILEDGRPLIVLSGSLEGKYLVEACLRHTAWRRDSVIFSLKEKSCYAVPGSEETVGGPSLHWLNELLSYWHQGQCTPLPFSLNIAMQFVQSWLKADGSQSQDALLTDAYNKKWQPYSGQPDASPAQCLCFDGDSPAAPCSSHRERFAEVAKIILSPVLHWAETVKECRR